MFEEIEAIISGKVQMVMYRDFTQATANALGVLGYVENLPDGTVRVVAQGTPDILKKFISHLNEGSVLAEVDEVSTVRHSAVTMFDDFVIRY